MIDTNALRKKVLDLAIRGKLVPQDPNDEPASVLLERIREEKQRLIKEGKIKKDKVDSVIFKGDDNCYYEKVGNSEPVLLEDLPFEIPTSWRWVRFSSLIKVISGVSYDKHDVSNKGIRILRGGNINNFNVSIEDNDVFLPNSYYDAEKQVQINDILIVASTGSKLAIGKAGYVTVNFKNTQIGAFLRIVRPLFEEIAEYTKTIFATSYYKEHILDSIRGSNINNLKNEHISNLLIPLPPIEEQFRIVKYIKEIFGLIDLIERNQADYDSLVDSLRKAILQSAIQGKLVEQDENDEPASVLLERIRTEKKAQLGKKYVESYIFKGVDNRYYEHIGHNEVDITEKLPFTIPNSWCWAHLRDLGVFSSGKTPSMEIEEYWKDGTVEWFSSKDMKQKYLKESQLKITKLAAKDMTIYPANTLLLVSRSGILKHTLPICIMTKEGTINQDIKAFQLYLLSMSDYIYFMLKGLEKIVIEDYAKEGTTVNSLKFEEFSTEMFVPIPPIAEQERIVNKINEIFAQL